MPEVPDELFNAAVEPPADELRALRLAISDPGHFLPRNGLPVVAWSARAVYLAGFRRIAPTRRPDRSPAPSPEESP